MMETDVSGSIAGFTNWLFSQPWYVSAGIIVGGILLLGLAMRMFGFGMPKQKRGPGRPRKKKY